jgi:hypothetical protein
MPYSKLVKPVAFAAGSREAIDQAGADRIGHRGEHDWQGASRLEQWPHGGAAIADDHVRRERRQFRGMFTYVGLVGSGPADAATGSANVNSVASLPYSGHPPERGL